MYSLSRSESAPGLQKLYPLVGTLYLYGWLPDDEAAPKYLFCSHIARQQQQQQTWLFSRYVIIHFLLRITSSRIVSQNITAGDPQF